MLPSLRRRALLAAPLLASLTPRISQAQAQAEWPSRPIRIIIPSAAGGAADFIGRTLGRYLEPHLRQPVVVDNRPGAGGITGTEAAKQAAPDGYSFLIATNSTHSANQFLYRRLPYDPVQDFSHIGMLGSFATIAVVAADAPFKSIPALIAHARANPGRVFFGYYSSSSQVPAALLKARANLDITGAAYRNITQIVPDLISGQIQFAFLDSLSAAPALQSGRVVPIGVSAARRMPQYPDVPLVSEALPDFVVEGWFGLTAPARTPRPVLDRMQTLLRQAVEDPAVAEALTRQGLSPGFRSAEEMDRFLVADRARWQEWVRIAGIEPE
ncbi:MAG: tripartite tricarboxylate transporter substrate binding protein [Roseomonas sp.]|nr:tripartite tricarboxylate transporter substrate binding protein [Roseomonas sp.]MCA3390549.1 tripartite tricarboxylate transporter substrate binding protein [Roseomonas sp.]MCA3392278.1 tripartite tricarboxylate transporter substrate binding protein [Roseomonas sp.]MCA3408404.1 tripartite tricarboxylate transporter substrate binding protein [Roseomonas sp.]